MMPIPIAMAVPIKVNVASFWLEHPFSIAQREDHQSRQQNRQDKYLSISLTNLLIPIVDSNDNLHMIPYPGIWLPYYLFWAFSFPQFDPSYRIRAPVRIGRHRQVDSLNSIMHLT